LLRQADSEPSEGEHSEPTYGYLTELAETLAECGFPDGIEAVRRFHEQLELLMEEPCDA
jgi:hypothetical protein